MAIFNFYSLGEIYDGFSTHFVLQSQHSIETNEKNLLTSRSKASTQERACTVFDRTSLANHSAVHFSIQPADAKPSQSRNDGEAQRLIYGLTQPNCNKTKRWHFATREPCARARVRLLTCLSRWASAASVGVGLVLLFSFLDASRCNCRPSPCRRMTAFRSESSWRKSR